MAAELASSVASSTLGSLAAEHTTAYVRYLFCFGKIVEDFRNQSKKLELAIDRLQNEVDDGRWQSEVIEHDVEEWLTKAREELEDVQSLLDEIERKKCFSWCPALGWRYCLSKKVANKTPNVSKLVETCNFQRVGHRATLLGLEFIPSKDFMPSESSNSAFKEIMDALKKDAVNMIGLYGMERVGKTTLANEVGNQAKQLFDEVVIVTVSQTLSINNIQDKVADFLHLKFLKMTVQGRAEQLWLRIKNEKSILIILDDVWEELDLKAIGIPFGDDHKGCKIFITTRFPQVCTRMNCQEVVKLNILSENEAWALFKDNAGLKDVSSPLNDVAKEVARECKGLPLAIVTMGRALKDETLDGWKAAYHLLKDSGHSQDVCKNIYNTLEISYDYLKEDNSRSCLQLCSLFPENHEIEIEELTMYGFGQGMFHGVDSIEEARKKMLVTITNLQKSGFLLKSSNERCVKMHDMVRDFVHWITSRGENMFMVKNELMEWPCSESFGCYNAISLWNNEIENFPNKLEFSKLETLFFTRKSKKKPLRVLSRFFYGMKTLRVLLLQDAVFSLEALQFLTNLRTLCFKDCELKNISSLKNMKSLEIFALFNTNIHELPEELEELDRLKLLYFSGIGPSNVSSNLLSRLASLQELHVTTEENANLRELLCDVKSLTLTDINMIHTNFFSPSLAQSVTQPQRFKKFTYSKLKDFKFDKEMAELEVSLLTLENILKEPTCQASLQSLKDVTIQKCDEVKSLFSPCLAQSLLHAEQLEISQCNKLEQVFAFAQELVEQEATPFQNLTCLKLSSLSALKSIWKEPTHYVNLQSLKDVTIRKCGGLKSIFTPSLTQSLLHLEQLEISQCNKLEQVFAFVQEMAKQEVASLSNLTCLKLSSLPAMESIWKEPIHHASLQSLKDVIIHGCHKLKSIFSPCLFGSMLHLEQLEISQCNQLEQVFVFDKEVAELEVALLSNLTCLKLSSLPTLESIWKEPTHHASLQSLKAVNVHNCDKLKSIFTPCLFGSMLHLEQLEISQCNQLEQVFAFDKEVAELEVALLSNLTCLKLSSLPALESIWKEPTHHASLQSLKDVYVHNCDKLKSIFSPCLFGSMLHLEQLEISQRNQLEQVFAFDREVVELEVASLSNLTCLKLNSLPALESIWKEPTHHASLQSLKDVNVHNCDKLKSIFSPCLFRSMLHLEQLEISQCNQLEQVFAFDREMAELELPPLSNLTCLKLKSLPELSCIWREPTHLVNLRSLKTMKIQCCIKLVYFFSPTLAQTLEHLEELDVQDCNSLKHLIIEAENRDGVVSNMDGNVLWPNLKSLKIAGCKRLKYVFPVTLAQGLPNLESLRINDCPRLLRVFGMAKKMNRHRTKETVRHNIELRQLKVLKLENLQKLRSFCPKNYSVVLPPLEDF